MAPLPEPASPTRAAIFAGYEADRDDGFRAASRRLADRQALRAGALVRLPLGDARALPGPHPPALRDRPARGGAARPQPAPHRRDRARGRSRDRTAVACRGAWRALRRLARRGRARAAGGAEDLARRRVQDPFGEELPRAGGEGRGRGEAAALGADADLHAPDRDHPRALPRRLQGRRRPACRARPRRCRGRRAAARQGGAHHLRRPAAVEDLRGPELVGVPVLRPSRCLPPWRRGARHLPDLPAFDAGRWRLVLRPLGADARRRGPARAAARSTSSSPTSCRARWSMPATIMSSTACRTARPGSTTRGRRRHAEPPPVPAGRDRRDLRLLRRARRQSAGRASRPPAASRSSWRPSSRACCAPGPTSAS